jgi:hypothetical protein
MDWQHTAGGSFQLAELIDAHGGELISDLLHHYGIHYSEYLGESPKYQPQEILVYVMNLPLGSNFIAEIRGGPEFRGWDQVMYMLANAVDGINSNAYITLAANSDKKHRPKAPELVKRPEESKKKREAGQTQFAAMARMAHKRSGIRKVAKG